MRWRCYPLSFTLCPFQTFMGYIVVSFDVAIATFITQLSDVFSWLILEFAESRHEPAFRPYQLPTKEAVSHLIPQRNFWQKLHSRRNQSCAALTLFPPLE